MNLSKAIVNIKAFLPEDEDIIKIIDVCNLKPLNADWRIIFDPYGNSLSFKKDKTIFTNINDNPNTIQDIYFKSHPKTISSKSNWSMISLTENDSFFVWFLGVDNKLRSCCYMNDEWQENKPPLVCGINTLRKIVQSFDVDDYNVIMGSSIHGPYDGKVIKTWVTEWPPSVNMMLDLNLTNKQFGQKLIGELL